MLLRPILTFKSTKSGDFVLLNYRFLVKLGMTFREVGMTFREVGMAFGENCLLFVEVCRVLVVEAGEAEIIALAGLVHSLVGEECE